MALMGWFATVPLAWGRCWDRVHLNSVHITYNKHTILILLLLRTISIIQALRSSARMLKIATLCSKQMNCSRGDQGCEIMLVQAQSVGSSEQQQDPCFSTVTCHNACYHLATTGSYVETLRWDSSQSTRYFSPETHFGTLLLHTQRSRMRQLLYKTT